MKKTNWPTLEARMQNKLTCRVKAVKQLKEAGIKLSPLAEKILKNEKCKNS